MKLNQGFISTLLLASLSAAPGQVASQERDSKCYGNCRESYSFILQIGGPSGYSYFTDKDWIHRPRGTHEVIVTTTRYKLVLERGGWNDGFVEQLEKIGLSYSEIDAIKKEYDAHFELGFPGDFTKNVEATTKKEIIGGNYEG